MKKTITNNTEFYNFVSKSFTMKFGLVLEGGGMRGLFTEGVLNVFMEHGITFDGLVGVSAGVLFGCGYKSQQPKRGLNCNIRFIGDPEYMGIRSLLKTGNYSSPEYAYHIVPTQLDPIDAEAFEKNPMEFYVVCTDVEKGVPVYHQLTKCDYEALEWIRASASMPLVSKPIELNGMKLLDGGMTDSIPLKFFQSKGYEKNVVILTQPQGYRKTPSKGMYVFKIFNNGFPKITETMMNRHIMYNTEIEYITQQEKMGNTLLIYPDEKLNIGRVEQNKEKMLHVYELGRKKGLEILPQVLDFLKD